MSDGEIAAVTLRSGGEQVRLTGAIARQACAWLDKLPAEKQGDAIRQIIAKARPSDKSSQAHDCGCADDEMFCAAGDCPRAKLIGAGG